MDGMFPSNDEPFGLFGRRAHAPFGENRNPHEHAKGFFISGGGDRNSTLKS
jgi:hypothetical protein